ncbi:MAG: GspMb/PilO family protein [Holophagae bacterium]|jgi:hypothetical protein
MRAVDIRPWRRLLAVWLPAVLICVLAAGVFVWRTSESGSARFRIANQVQDLEAELVRLEQVRTEAAADSERVAELEVQFAALYEEVFGSLDGRLTGIMRAVGSATRGAGLLAGSYSYSATEDSRTGLIRFIVRYSVEGEYPQIRQMLAALQSSPEFLVVDTLSLAGDEDPVTRNLDISVSVSTFLAEADLAQLQRLIGKRSPPVEGDDG